jgi:cytochrome c peroxidase
MKLLISALLLVAVGLAAMSLRPSKPDRRWAERKMPASLAELGEELFFDPILSKDNTISCASCHKPQFAFADNKAVSEGISGFATSRNTPSVMYVELSDVFFWDGRARTLEHQAFFPITHEKEMGSDKPGVLRKLKTSPYYIEAFNRICQDTPGILNVSKALAEFQRTLSFYRSAFDRFYAGDDNAISESALNGLSVFINKADCGACHNVGLGKDGLETIRNIGLFNGKDKNDRGRFDFTHDSADLGKFKTPHLRNLSFTAPYMHDGSLKTLREVIDYYDKPASFVKGIINMDTLFMRDSLELTEKEKVDLEAFLLTLNDDNLPVLLKRLNERATAKNK